MKILSSDPEVTSGPDQMLSQRHLKITHLVLPKGTTIQRHQSLMTVTVVSIKGSIQFHTDDEVTTLTPGKAVVMTPGEFHWLEAPDADGEVIVVHGVLAQ
ncbi:cupin domain-containing protein [Secundilactobacillus collinoides]|uniref:Cupin 2 conserved barrel domain-containing protein n=2 Tax=Secundilactobacillus collinoides TaxID=33960 RepID=A0A0R2B2P5_SECCO|nr:hypothetical protein [Secundilactobacillus collinoides]KRM73745.1 hypothetical protein FC82_GL001182 [Secundilactobacillus collinoides DSM 20515 = JCM 1123]KZL35999.1 hypothetical protein TY91_14415 [Secundilactobacillus collinoides]